MVCTLCALGLSAAAARADGLPCGVKDEAKLFRPEAAARADEQAREIRRLYHRDVLVETLPAVPEAERRDVHNMTHAKADEYFARRARERAEALGLSGLYVLICADPRYVQVIAYPAGQEDVFTEVRRQEVRKLLQQRLPTLGSERSLLRRLFGPKPRPDAADEALLDVFRRARSMLRASFPEVEGKTDPAAAGDAALAGLALGLVAVWLALRLVGRRFARADGPAAEPPGYRAGRLGGMFGTPAGFWIYDRLFRDVDDAAAPAGGLELDAPAPAGPTETPADGEPGPDAGVEPDRPLHDAGEPAGPARVPSDEDRPA
jgi:hypothetical protein